MPAWRVRATFHATLLGLLLASLPAPAATRGPEIRLHINDAALAMWQLRWTAEQAGAADSSGPAADLDYPHYRSVPWPAGSRDAQGWFSMPPTRLEGHGMQIRLEKALVRLGADGAEVLIADARNQPWLIADMAHQMPGPQLDWRHLSLRPLPALAKALGSPRLAFAALGALSVRGGPALRPKGLVDCRASVQWPGPGLPVDVALSAINVVNSPRSRDCSGGSCVQPSPAGSSAGEVVVVPDALLTNHGTRDVPWYQKFSPDSPPYGNDQHPYLVWAMYRLNADGGLVPLGASGVKHAFYATNSGCSCLGDFVLYRGCGDLYSEATNDMPTALGLRGEIDPFSGRWGRCGSVFDPACSGVQDNSQHALAFDRRLLVAESDLLPSLHPGARWYIEAWYVVRDDATLDNNIGHRQLLPAKTDAAWSFQPVASLQPGPLISQWVDPAAAAPLRQARRATLAGGRVQLAVQIDDLGNGRWRYRYALMNLDYADSRFSGSGSALRMESSRGVRGIGWQAERAAVANLVFRDDDRKPDTDWVAPAAGTLQLSAPGSTDLGWGRLATISFDSALAPSQDEIILQLGDGQTAALQLLAPTPAQRVFRSGFEAP